VLVANIMRFTTGSAAAGAWAAGAWVGAGAADEDDGADDGA